MRRPGGYAVLTTPQTAVVNLDGLRCEEVKAGALEMDTFSCFHCGRITHVQARMDPANLGGLCKICYHLICPHCVGKGCDPFEAKLIRAEQRDIALRSYGV